MTKVSCVFMCRSKASYRPAKFGGHKQRDSKNKIVSVYHVILQDNIIKVSCEFRCRNW